MNWITRLFTEIDELISVLSTKLNTLYDYIGNLESLNTTNKTNLVAAINEINAISTNVITTNTNQTGLSGNKTTSGTWTFSSSPIVPNGTLNNHAVNLGQLNSAIATIPTYNMATAQNQIYGNAGLSIVANAYKTVLYGGNYGAVATISIDDTGEDANSNGSEVIINCNATRGAVIFFQTKAVMVNGASSVTNIPPGNEIKIHEGECAKFIWAEEHNAYLMITTTSIYSN